MEKKKGLSRIIKACVYSFQGLCELWNAHVAFKQEVLFFIITLPLMLMGAVFYHSHPLGMILYIVMSALLVLLMEGVNSAIELLADRITKERDDAIKKAKDIGSALVFLAILHYISVMILLLYEILK